MRCYQLLATIVVSGSLYPSSQAGKTDDWYYEDQPDTSPLFSLWGTTEERSFGEKIVMTSSKYARSPGHLLPCSAERHFVLWLWLWKKEAEIVKEHAERVPQT